MSDSVDRSTRQGIEYIRVNNKLVMSPKSTRKVLLKESNGSNRTSSGETIGATNKLNTRAPDRAYTRTPNGVNTYCVDCEACVLL